MSRTRTDAMLKTMLRGIALLSAGLSGLALPTLPAAAQVTEAEDIVYPPMPTVERPQPQRTVLANGMVVMLLEDHELPLVEARVRVRTGGRWEPADKVGLAELTGQVLRSGGTESIRSDELDDLLEDRAAILETSIGTTSGSAFLSCLVDDFPEMLEIFADVLRHPAFEEEKLAVAKNQVVAGIARQNDDASAILAREFRELVYGSESPYARSPTYATIDNVSRDDLVAWHRKYFHPDRMILGLVGDFDSAAALKLVEKVFGDWPRGIRPSGPAVTDPTIEVTEPEPGIHFAVKNDVNQSNIRIGHLGVRRDHPDYYALEVMNQVLGGSFASRLFSRVRGQKGLAYNVRGSVQSQWDYPGVFLMTMSTKTETTGAGIEALYEEARNMTAEPPTDDEVERARSAILNSFVFLADSTGEILSRQLTYEYFGYPLDWLDRYRRGIDGVTAAQVRAAAAKHIRPESFVTLVVGPEEGADRPLSDFGEVEIVDLTIPEPETPAVEVTEEGRERAGELLAEAVDALGGAERLDGLRSIETAAEMTLTAPQGTMSARTRTVVVYPDRMRQEMTMPMGTMVTVLDGDSGFQQMGPQSRPLPDSQRADARRSLRRDPVGLLRLRASDGFVAIAAGSDEVDGAVVELVNVQLDGDSVTLGIDPESGRVRTVSYRGSVMGRPGEIRQVLSDFREVEGLTLPFAVASSLDGEPMVEVAVESIVVDGEIDEALFAPPAGAAFP